MFSLSHILKISYCEPKNKLLTNDFPKPKKGKKEKQNNEKPPESSSNWMSLLGRYNRKVRVEPPPPTRRTIKHMRWHDGVQKLRHQQVNRCKMQNPLNPTLSTSNNHKYLRVHDTYDHKFKKDMDIDADHAFLRENVFWP